MLGQRAALSHCSSATVLLFLAGAESARHPASFAGHRPPCSPSSDNALHTLPYIAVPDCCREDAGLDRARGVGVDGGGVGGVLRGWQRQMGGLKYGESGLPMEVPDGRRDGQSGRSRQAKGLCLCICQEIFTRRRREQFMRPVTRDKSMRIPLRIVQLHCLFH